MRCTHLKAAPTQDTYTGHFWLHCCTGTPVPVRGHEKYGAVAPGIGQQFCTSWLEIDTLGTHTEIKLLYVSPASGGTALMGQNMPKSDRCQRDTS